MTTVKIVFFLKSHFVKFLTAIFIFVGFLSHAQFIQDTLKLKSANYIVLPLVFRSPETLWAIGISGSASFKTGNKRDTTTRVSSVQALGLLTQQHQNIQAIDATIYFPKDRYVFLFQSSHSYFPDKYWGVGPETSDKFERYRFEQFSLVANMKKRIVKNIFVGLLYEFQNVYNVAYKVGGHFDTTILHGKEDHFVSGLGASISYDSRNASFWPTKGILIQTQGTYFNTYLGSDYNNFKTTIDFRIFQKIGHNHVLAFQVYSYSNRGQTPLRQMAILGGLNNLRGYYQGRFRDNSMISVITEYRVPIKGRFAACAFFGMGNVYNEFMDLRHTDKNIKFAYGGGLRFALLKKDRLNLRLDYGYRDNFNRGFYFTVGECF